MPASMPIRPPQRIPLSTRVASPEMQSARAHLRMVMFGATVLTLVITPLLALSGCGASSSHWPGLASASPSAGAGSPTAGTGGPTVRTVNPTAGAGQTPPPAASKTPSSPTITPTPPPVRPTVHQVGHTATLSGASTGSVAATCPQGELALGGGWGLSPQSARVLAATVTNNAWVVSVMPVGQPATMVVTAVVECLAGAPGAVVTQYGVTNNIIATPADRLNTELSPRAEGCSPNEALVGAGFDLGTATDTLELLESLPSGGKWLFMVRNNDTVTHPFMYYVECLSQVGVSASYLDADGNPAYASATTSATALCPSDAAVAGGGFWYMRNSPGNQYLGNPSIQAATATNAWQSFVYIVSGYGLTTATSTAAAVCLSFP